MNEPLPENALISRLLSHRQMLVAYVQKKVADRTLAEDVLQDSLLGALRAAPDLRDEDRLMPWFYRILNNAITDLYRRRGVEAKHRHAPIDDPLMSADPSPDEVAILCSCFRELIPTLKPEYAELIMKLELSETTPEHVAQQLGLSRNNLKVRRHRARQALRRRLEETCRVCARHGCLDCTCQRH